jgi:hypothetical protein
MYFMSESYTIHIVLYTRSRNKAEHSDVYLLGNATRAFYRAKKMANLTQLVVHLFDELSSSNWLYGSPHPNNEFLSAKTYQKKVSQCTELSMVITHKCPLNQQPIDNK